jgi:hypothetical protein
MQNQFASVDDGVPLGFETDDGGHGGRQYLMNMNAENYGNLTAGTGR